MFPFVSSVQPVVLAIATTTVAAAVIAWLIALGFVLALVRAADG